MTAAGRRERGTVLWQRAEGAGMFLSGIVAFLALGSGIPWWGALLLFFAPDVGFAAYAFGPRIGAGVYNLLHLYATGAILLAAGLALGAPVPEALGALWIAHAGFDRMLGYGLKSVEGFRVTHLGRIG